jgi:hypothetical protein
VQPITIAAIKAVARQQNATLVEYAIVPDDDFKVQGKQRAREAELLIWVVQPTGEVAVRRVDLKPLWQNGVTLVDVVRLARCLTPQPICRDLAQKVRGLESVEPLQSTPTSPRRAHVWSSVVSSRGYENCINFSLSRSPIFCLVAQRPPCLHPSRSPLSGSFCRPSGCKRQLLN